MENLIKHGKFLVFALVITAIGYIKLLHSVKSATESASEYLRTSTGGMMETSDYQVMLKGYILTNVTLGGIIFLVGFAFFCISIYMLLKEFRS